MHLENQTPLGSAKDHRDHQEGPVFAEILEKKERKVILVRKEGTGNQANEGNEGKEVLPV